MVQTQGDLGVLRFMFIGNISTTDRDVITTQLSLSSGQKGVLIFNTTSGFFEYWDGTEWFSLPPFDLSTVGDADLFAYNSTTNVFEAVSQFPTTLSAGYLTGGNVLVADGSAYTDIFLQGTIYAAGAPSSTDGWDGWLWRDSTTNRLYGPKGDDTPGQWPTTYTIPFERDNDNHKLATHLDLNGNSLFDGDGQLVLSVLHLNEDSDDDVGVQFILGDTGDAAPYFGMRSASGTANTDFRIGGQGTGRVMTLGGDEFSHAGWPFLALKRHTNVDSLSNGSREEILWDATPELEIGSFTLSGGTDATNIDTVEFGGVEEGLYELYVDVRWDNGQGNSDIRVECLVAGGCTLLGSAERWTVGLSNRDTSINATYCINVTDSSTAEFTTYLTVFNNNYDFESLNGALYIKRIR